MSDQIKSITNFASLVKFLREDLDWPIDAEDVGDVAFDYDPDELGLDREHAVKIRAIKQIRPLRVYPKSVIEDVVFCSF